MHATRPRSSDELRQGTISAGCCITTRRMHTHSKLKDRSCGTCLAMMNLSSESGISGYELGISVNTYVPLRSELPEGWRRHNLPSRCLSLDDLVSCYFAPSYYDAMSSALRLLRHFLHLYILPVWLIGVIQSKYIIAFMQNRGKHCTKPLDDQFNKVCF
jgi:hypothetical protein